MRDVRAFNEPARQIERAPDRHQILVDKFNMLAKQVSTGMRADTFFVPVLGQIAPERSMHEVMLACVEQEALDIRENPADGGVTARRVLQVSEDAPKFISWNYTFNPQGRLTGLRAYPADAEKRPSRNGPVKEYSFHYNQDGRLERANLCSYGYIEGRRGVLEDKTLHSRMRAEFLPQARSRTLQAFLGREPLAAEMSGGAAIYVKEDLSRLSSAGAAQVLSPRERVSELTLCLAFMEDLIVKRGQFSGPAAPLLRQELESQFFSARAELRDMRREEARDRLEVEFALHGVFSGKVLDAYSDPDASLNVKRARLLDLGRGSARAVTAARGLSIQADCRESLKAVRVAWDLLKVVEE